MKTISYIVSVTCLAVLFYCGKGPENRFNSAREQYGNERVEKNRVILQESLLDLVTLKKYGQRTASGDGIVYTPSGETVKVHWPLDISVAVTPGYIAASCDGEGGCAFSTGSEAELFGTGGGITGKLEATPKVGISGLLAFPDRVVFLKGAFLYNSSWSGEDVKKILDGDVVTPPGTGIAPRAVILEAAGRYAVNVGNAGMYNLSVVDAGTKTPLLKNFQNASLKFNFDGASVFCITGVTGKWTLVKYSVDLKKTEALRVFSVLRDVEFCDGFLAAVKDEGVLLFDYSQKEEIAVPFPCDLAGRAGKHPVLKINGALHVVDHKLLVEKIRELERDIPEFFKVR